MRIKFKSGAGLLKIKTKSKVKLINNIIDYLWFNESLNSFKIKCKNYYSNHNYHANLKVNVTITNLVNHHNLYFIYDEIKLN